MKSVFGRIEMQKKGAKDHSLVMVKAIVSTGKKNYPLDGKKPSKEAGRKVSQMAQRQYIKYLFKVEGKNFSEFHRETGFNYRTVQKYPYQENWNEDTLPNLSSKLSDSCWNMGKTQSAHIQSALAYQHRNR